MKTPFIFVILVAGLSVTTAWAGSPSNPDWTDAQGDTAAGSVDIASGWIQSTASEVIVTLKIRDLSEPSPALDTEGAYHNYYRIEWTLNGARYYAETQVHFVESTSEAGTTTPRIGTPVRSNVGTTFEAGRINPQLGLTGTATVDLAANTVVMKIARGTLLAPGTVMSQIGVTTFQNDDAFEAEPGLAQFIGGGKLVRDTATTTRTVTI